MKFPEITIRPMDIDVLPKMVDIWNESKKWLTSSKRGHTIETLTDWYNKRNQDNHHYLGYFQDMTLLGFLIVRMEPGKIWLKMLAVDSEHRSHGIGRSLVNYVLSNRGSEEMVFTECLEDNVQGLNFFLHAGFEIYGKDSDSGDFVLKYTHKK